MDLVQVIPAYAGVIPCVTAPSSDAERNSRIRGVG